MISFATEPKYDYLLLLEKSAPLFPTQIKSIKFDLIPARRWSLIISADLLPNSLDNILISLYLVHPSSSIKYSTFSLTFTEQIFSCSQIITFIKSLDLLILQIYWTILN